MPLHDLPAKKKPASRMARAAPTWAEDHAAMREAAAAAVFEHGQPVRWADLSEHERDEWRDAAAAGMKALLLEAVKRNAGYRHLLPAPIVNNNGEL